MAGERESSIIGFTALYESDLLSYEDAIETLEVGIQPTDTYNKWGVKIMFDHVSLFKGKPTKGRIHLTHQHVANRDESRMVTLPDRTKLREPQSVQVNIRGNGKNPRTNHELLVVSIAF